MRIDHTRLRLQIPVLAAMSAAIVSVLISFGGRTPLVIYNASGSAPLGFYYLENRFPDRGETAVVRPPPLIELMITARGLLPPSVPLLKQIAAVGAMKFAVQRNRCTRLLSTARSLPKRSTTIVRGVRCRSGRGV